MTENEQRLTAEVNELREGMLHLLAIVAKTRWLLFSAPDGRVVGRDAAKDHVNLTNLCYQIREIPESTPNIIEAPWAKALEARSGLSMMDLWRDHCKEGRKEYKERRENTRTAGGG